MPSPYLSRAACVVLGFCFAVACSTERDSSASPRDAGAESAVEEPDAASSDREGPEGCYFVSKHSCDCRLDEAECVAGAGTWTTGCSSCQDSPVQDGGASGVADAAVESAWGCYDAQEHSCDCEAVEDSCQAAGGLWTEQCSVCTEGASASSPDAGAAKDAESRDAGASAFACYDPAAHSCGCSVSEQACAESGGLWTDECTACGGDAGAPAPPRGGKPDAGQPPESSLDAGDAAAPAWACYDPQSHACSCTATEASCANSGGIWTDGCDSCG